MTREERLRGNEIIARYAQKGFAMSHITDYTEGLPVELNRRYLRYHRLYDELIPVVKKLKAELWNSAPSNPIDKAYNRLARAIPALEIQELWAATVSAIETINKLKDADN